MTLALPKPPEVDESLITEIQRRLLSEHAEVLTDADPFRRRVRLRGAIGTLLHDRRLDGATFARVLQVVSDRIVGLGQLEPLMRDPAISEIMVNGPRAVYVERNGELIHTEISFEDDAAVSRVIERILAPLGLRIDGTQPWVDARLPDGARVHAILPPLATAGPVLTVRRFARVHPTLEQLVETGSMTSAQLVMLRQAVMDRRNMLVVGGTASGKTTLLRALCQQVPVSERIITIEDSAELALKTGHVVALESRPPNIEGQGEVTIRDLVRQALRMRPDRIVVGEVRGVEVLEMLAVMNTGHEGSMSTLHANSAAEVVPRIEAMAAGAGFPTEALRRQMLAAVDLIVEVSRVGGRRRVQGVFTLTGDADRVLVLPAEMGK